MTPTTATEAFGVLLEPGQITELRAFLPNGSGGKVTYSGYFDNAEDLVSEAARLDKLGASAVYFTLNPARHELISRSPNKARRAGKGETTSDEEIIRRRWLLVDCDPHRKSGTSATDDEKGEAGRRAEAVRGYLQGEGWPEPVRADSGNGFHLLYRVDLSADDGGLVRRVLHALSDRFSDDAVRVDTTVHNASRICKLYGTTARKGEATEERPHRRARVLSIPEPLEPVPVEKLERTAGLPAAGSPKGTAAKKRPMKPVTIPDGTKYETLRTYGGALRHVGAPAAHIETMLQEARLKHGETPGEPEPVTKLVEWLETKEPEDDKEDKSTALEILLDVAMKCRFFQGTDGEAYAAVPKAKGTDTVAVRSILFERWLRAAFYEAAPLYRKRSPARAPSEDALKQAVLTLEARALYGEGAGGKERVFLRTGGAYDADGYLSRIYIDLANEGGECVEIMPGEWRIIENPPVHLLRTNTQHTLPRPDPAGRLDDLLPMLRTERAHEKAFIVAWLVFAFHPDGPYPVLVLHGPAGSGKTNETKFIRSLVDPAETLVGRPPKSEEDAFVRAKHNAVVALENVSRISDALSDALCSIATGAGVAARALYTNADESSYTVKRPILINGIDEFVKRNDLASRTMTIHIPPLGDDRELEAEIKRARDAARPKVLGGICHALAEALRHPGHRPKRLPRMADFAAFVDSARAAMPKGLPDLIAALGTLHDETARERADESPICCSLRAALAHRSGSLEADMKTLFESLERHRRKGQSWPRNVQAFRSTLRRDMPLLENMGIRVEALDRLCPVTRRALYRITAAVVEGMNPSDPSDPSEAIENGPNGIGKADSAPKDSRRIPEGSKHDPKDPSPDPSAILRNGEGQKNALNRSETAIGGKHEGLAKDPKDPKDPVHAVGGDGVCTNAKLVGNTDSGDGLPETQRLRYIAEEDGEEVVPDCYRDEVPF